MKRFLIIAMACIMLAGSVTSLAACGGGGNEEGDVVMSFLYGTTSQKDTGIVEEAVSNYVKEKLGFGVKFKEVAAMDTETTYVNWLSTNKDVDLLNVFMGDPRAYITQKRAREISSYLTQENTPYLYNELKNHPEATVYGDDGKIYGVSVFVDTPYSGYCYAIRKDVLVDCGLYSETAADGKYTDGQQISYDDLNTIFATVKEKMPTNKSGQNVYPCSVHTSVNFNNALICYDKMGSEKYPMGVMMMDPVTGEFTGEVENYYTSDEFKEYVNWIGGCYEKGYVHPDVQTMSDTMQDLYKREQFVGVMLQNATKLISEWEINYGWDLVRLPVSVPFYFVTDPNQAVMVSSKSKRPKKAMQLLDLIYSDAELVNLIYYGIQDRHWKFVDEENGLVTEASKGSRDAYSIGGFWGQYDKYYTYVKDGDDVSAIIAKNNENKALTAQLIETALTHSSPAIGFRYDSKKNDTRIRNLENNVLPSYYNTIVVGSGKKGSDGTWTGAGSTYAEFIEKLNRGKINDLIADKQSQYEAWKASK